MKGEGLKVYKQLKEVNGPIGWKEFETQDLRCFVPGVTVDYVVQCHSSNSCLLYIFSVTMHTD